MILSYCNPKDGKLNLEQPSVFKDAVKGLRARRHAIEIKECDQDKNYWASNYPKVS
jgi:hypothetical protein